ncbi:DUF6538 domain-containing protein, partial [Acidocella sp.]|uniref:DUF6538 domain-containing protein n=1 Tax=Acidocella sp. TaxID=50710 RepID=UPI00261B57EB
MTAKDTRWLELRHKTWYAVLEVPRPLRSAMGKKRLKQSLKTHSLPVAQARRHAVLADFQKQIAAASGGHASNDLIQEGLAYRDQFDRIRRGDSALITQLSANGSPWEYNNPFDQTPPQQAAIEWVDLRLHDRVDAMRTAGQHDEAGILASVAQGKATPLDTYMEAWLAEGGARGPVTARTAIKYRAIFDDLTEWLARERLPCLLEAVTKDIVGRWVTSLLSSGVHSRTINAKVSAMSSYWRWLMKRTSIRQNPWANQAIAQYQKPGVEKPKRAYTAAELTTLLNGKPSPELHDAIRIAALSGMRLDEIYRLK